MVDAPIARFIVRGWILEPSGRRLEAFVAHFLKKCPDSVMVDLRAERLLTRSTGSVQPRLGWYQRHLTVLFCSALVPKVGKEHLYVDLRPLAAVYVALILKTRSPMY